MNLERYTYLLIDLGSLAIPFVFSFHPKLRFDKKWRTFLPAMLAVALVFLIWDEYFTQIGVWGFNPRYLTGLYVFSLPLEEILFFICIPYACVFTYHCFQVLNAPKTGSNATLVISVILIVLLQALVFSNLGKWYTNTTFVLIGITIAWLQFKSKWDNLGRFYFAYLILLVPFFITNGILTGTGIEDQVVWYNDQENLGVRMGTIPVEDTFYGMLLILWNVVLMEYFEKRKISPPKALQ